MRRRALTRGERVIVTGGVALLLTSFLPWFGVGHESHHTGWQNLPSRVAIVLGLVMVLQVIARRVGADLPGPWLPWGTVHLVVGTVALVLVVVQIVVGDELLVGEVPVRLARRPGLFLGLAAAVALTCGGLLRSLEPEPRRSRAL